jgi:hypothetical protein
MLETCLAEVENLFFAECASAFRPHFGHELLIVAGKHWDKLLGML